MKVREKMLVEMGIGRYSTQQASITDRDLEMLRWIARCRFATAEQVAARFGVHSTKCYRRLKPIIGAGLLKRESLLHNQPGALHITRKGLHLLAMGDMPVPTVSLQSFLHDHAVVWEQVNLEKRDLEVLTEREMRHLARSTGENYQLRIPASHQSNSATHMPDLAFRIGGAWRAVEVELASKSEARLTAILAGYLAAEQFAGVVYCVPTEDAIRRVQSVGDSLGMGSRLQTVRVSEGAAA